MPYRTCKSCLNTTCSLKGEETHIRFCGSYEVKRYTLTELLSELNAGDYAQTAASSLVIVKVGGQLYWKDLHTEHSWVLHGHGLSSEQATGYVWTIVRMPVHKSLGQVVFEAINPTGLWQRSAKDHWESVAQVILKATNERRR